MEASDELFVKLLNLWFFKKPPEGEISDGMKGFAVNIIKMAQYGDDKIFSHPKICEIIQLLKDYGFFEYEKSVMELYYEGRMRVQIELREMFNSPEVSLAMQALSNVLGKMMKPIIKEVQKKIEEEKNASAIPYLASKHIFEN